MMNHLAEAEVEYNNYQKSGAGRYESSLACLEIKGPDATDFLQRITSQNIITLTTGHGNTGAMLQPNAMILFLFNIYKLDFENSSGFLMLMGEIQARLAAETLEKFHFAENLTIQDKSDEFKFISIQGVRSSDVLKKIFPVLPEKNHDVARSLDLGFEVLIVKESDFSQGTTGFWLRTGKSDFAKLVGKLETLEVTKLSQETLHLMRLESQHIQFGTDIGEKNLILEAPLSPYVSRNKGCYPGQEVVERVFTYGNVAKKLMGVKFDQETQLSNGTKIFSGDKEVGVITSSGYLPWLGKTLAVAMVRKPFYYPGQKVALENYSGEGELQELPNSFPIEQEKKSS